MIAVQKPLLIALAVLLFFVFNAFNHLVFKDARLDLTEGQLYTLSEGSLNLVQGIEEPVQLYFFFSEAASRDLTPIRSYADRVESMLEEFALASNGMLLVERIDPALSQRPKTRLRLLGCRRYPSRRRVMHCTLGWRDLMPWTMWKRFRSSSLIARCFWSMKLVN